jgi:hypothetical protein
VAGLMIQVNILLKPLIIKAHKESIILNNELIIILECNIDDECLNSTLICVKTKCVATEEEKKTNKESEGNARVFQQSKTCPNLILTGL